MRNQHFSPDHLPEEMELLMIFFAQENNTLKCLPCGYFRLSNIGLSPLVTSVSLMKEALLKTHAGRRTNFDVWCFILQVKIMLLEDSASGFCGLVYTQAVTPRVYIFQFVKFMLITLFWKSIHFPCFSSTNLFPDAPATSVLGPSE